MDECKNCVARGDLGKCMGSNCNQHDSWLVGELTKALYTTESDKIPADEPKRVRSERDALAKQVRDYEEALSIIESMYQECQQAQENSKSPWVAEEGDCPLDDGCCAECNYFEAYALYLRRER